VDSKSGSRWWRWVTRTAWVGAAVCLLLVVLLDPSVAERWLSADASLERASRKLLRTVQIALAAAGGLLVELGRRFRQHSARKERLVLGILFAAGAIVVSIVLCEAGLRAASTIRPLTAERHFFFLHDEVLGWRHRPGAVARFKNAVVRINSLGLRGVEIATTPAPSDVRILFLGDSQVFGDGVEGDETFVQGLERELRGIQAINAGVIGYGTDQQVLYYERDGAALGAKVIVVGMNAYDLRDNLSNRVRSGYLKPRFELSAGQLTLVNVPISPGSVVDRVQRRMRSQSFLYTFLTNSSRRRSAQREDAASSQDSLDVYPSDAHLDVALSVTRALLGRLAVDVKTHGGRLVVAFLPYEMDFSDDEGYSARSDRVVGMLEEAGRQEGFLAWDLRGYLDPHGRLYLDTMHFNSEGHRQVAVALKRLSVEEGVISRDHAR
jgi:hypothetical protein